MSSQSELCEACEGWGWLLVSVDGYNAPPTMVFVERCDECEKYIDDYAAADSYSADTGKTILAVLCRAEENHESDDYNEVED